MPLHFSRSTSPATIVTGLSTERTSCVLNSIDLAYLGVSIDRTEGLWDAPSIREGMTEVPNRTGRVWDGSIEAEPRVVTLTGWIRGRTRAEFVQRHDTFQLLVDQGIVEAVFRDFATALMLVRRAELRVNLHSPQKLAKAARFELTLEAADSLLHEISDRVYALSTSRTPIPLGLRWSSAIIRAFGPGSNPTTKYRGITGAVLHELGFTLTLAANQYTEANCLTQECWLKEAGSAPVAISPNDATDFFSLDPRDGRAASGDWPTLEQSLPGEVQIRRTW